MPHRFHPSRDLEELTAAALSGEIDNSAVGRLETMLRADADALRWYREMVSLQVDLRIMMTARRSNHKALERIEIESQSPADPSVKEDASPQSQPGLPGPHRTNRSPVLGFLHNLLRVGHETPMTAALMWLVMAIVCSGLVLTVFFCISLIIHGVGAKVHDGAPNLAKNLPSNSGRGAGGEGIANSPLLPAVPSGMGEGSSRTRDAGEGNVSPSPALPISSSPVARLVRVVRCRWGKGAEPAMIGDLAVGQQLRLESGLAEINCPKGFELLLQGPAQLTIESDHSVFLAEGRLTARLTRPEARGFSVRTPHSNVVDLGTEFGVDVAPGGDQNVHVFQGQVEFSVTPKNGPPVAQHKLTVNQGVRVCAETQAADLIADTGEGFTRSIDKPGHDPHTVAYWRFEDHPVGALVPDSGLGCEAVRGTVDSSGNGNDLFTWSTRTAPRFSADVAAVFVPKSGKANCSSLDNSSPLDPVVDNRNLYSNSPFSHASPIDIQKISPKQWTIEASVKTASLDHTKQVFVGRDGSRLRTLIHLRSRLAFSITKINEKDRFVIEFLDADNRPWQALADRLLVEKGRWYHVAATSDGLTLRLYVDANDGLGYQLRASTSLSTNGNTALGMGSEAAEWSIGRSRDDAGRVDAWFQGWIDEVRVSDVARQPSEFLFCAGREVAAGNENVEQRPATDNKTKPKAITND